MVIFLVVTVGVEGAVEVVLFTSAFFCSVLFLMTLALAWDFLEIFFALAVFLAIEALILAASFLALEDLSLLSPAHAFC
jgi:hypothetical protein